jgi:hypothetical protein
MLLVALLAIVIAGAAAFMTGLWPATLWPDDLWPRRALPSVALPVLTQSGSIPVSPGESIAAAVSRAAAGATVVVEPGEYREQVQLKSGVRIRSRVPRGATLRLQGGATDADAAVVAVGVTDAEMSGFRIVGDAATPLGSGIYLRDAAVSLTDIEVTGAAVAAVEIASGSGASLTALDVRDNPGAGLVVRAGAGPRIAHSVFARNGGSRPSGGAIAIEAGAVPTLDRNVFQGVTVEALGALTADQRNAIRGSNWFLLAEPLRTPARASGSRRASPARGRGGERR